METMNEERAAFEDYCREIGYTLKVGDSGRYLGGYGAELWAGFKAGAAWQRTQATVVPEGWQLVPVEPTPAMRVIGARDCSSLIQPDHAGEVWRAMLGAVVVPAAYAFAAPAHPAEQQDQGEVQRRRDWIACTERLPADKRDVMVYCADSDEHMVGSSIGGGLFLFATARHGEKVVCRPTHWRYIDESDKPDLAASAGQEVEK